MSGPVPLPHTPLDAFDSTPLFMRELPAGQENDPLDFNNNTLAALQSLLHDGDPEGAPQISICPLDFDFMACVLVVLDFGFY